MIPRLVRRFHAVPAQLSAHSAARRRTTVSDLLRLRAENKKISVLTAHDFITGKIANDSGVDMVLVGDSLAMVALGYESTNQIPFQEFLYHCKAVARGAPSSFLVADLPFGSYEASSAHAMQSAVKLVAEGGANAVKLEGGEEVGPTIRALTNFGIPVVGHVGLTPQRANALSGFKVQGSSVASALRILRDARAVEEAGAFALVLEAVPEKLAAYITSRLSIPTIGIGAGPACSGQVLVQADLLGMVGGSHEPKFLKKYGNFYDSAVASVRQYIQDVQSVQFPVVGQHTYKMKDEVYQEFVAKADQMYS